MTGSELDNASLVRDLVSWVAEDPRPYEEVMDAWRTSCPRLTVWEDAIDAELLEVEFAKPGGRRIVTVTDAGRQFLEDFGKSA